MNPFSHPRVLFSDFQVGEKLLQHAFSEVHKKLRIRPSPIVVIHPMEKTEGGLTMIEKRAFRELAISAGASEVYLYQGQPLSLAGFEISQISEKEDIPQKTHSSSVGIIFYAAIIMAYVFYAVNN